MHASFDDPHLVSRAGLVPVMALAQRAGLGGLVAAHVRLGRRCGVNAHVKVPCLVAGMIGGRAVSMTWVRHEAHCLYRPRSGRGSEEVSVGLMAYLDP